jgi:hypothetical protein
MSPKVIPSHIDSTSIVLSLYIQRPIVLSLTAPRDEKWLGLVLSPGPFLQRCRLGNEYSLRLRKFLRLVAGG